jgi:transposase InsO family protein
MLRLNPANLKWANDDEDLGHSLNVEAIHGERFATREQAKAHVFEYIEVNHDRDRLHSTLDYLGPEEFELHHVD